MKKYVIISMVLLVLLGCSGSGSKSSSESKVVGENIDANAPAYLLDTSPLEVDWYIHYEWFGVTPNNLVQQEIENVTGIKINYSKPLGEPSQKINTMIASGELPDMITIGSYQTDAINNLIDGGLVLPLDTLAEQYDPYFFQVAQSNRLDWFRQEDGHVYGYPNASWSIADVEMAKERGSYEVSSPYTFVVRKDMYEAIGSPSMRTPEEFLRALEMAKEAFPMVDGQPLIPLGIHDFTASGNISLDSMLFDFLNIPREKDGSLYDRAQDPEYKRWLETMNEAYRREFILEDAFIDKRPQIEEKITQGRYFAMLFQRTDFMIPQSLRYQEDPNSIYIAIDGPANSTLDNPSFNGPSIQGWTTTYISKKAKHPERLIRLMTFLMSPEGQTLLVLGKEGVTWEYVDGAPRFTQEVKQALQGDRPKIDSYGIDFSHWMLMDVPFSTSFQDKIEQASPQKELVFWSIPYVESYPEYTGVSVPSEAKDESRILERVNREWGKNLPLLIRASSLEEFDQLYQEVIDERNRLGYQKVLDYQYAQVEKNRELLYN